MHPRAPNSFRYGSGAVAFGMHCGYAASIKARLAASIDTVGLCPFDSLALPLFDEAPLHLRDHAQHRHNDMPHLASRRYVRVEHGHEGTLRFTFMHEVEDVPCIAPEPIDARDNQFVAGPQELKYGGEFEPASRLAPDIFSDRTIAQPSLLSLAICSSRSWSAVLTRA